MCFFQCKKEIFKKQFSLGLFSDMAVDIWPGKREVE